MVRSEETRGVTRRRLLAGGGVAGAAIVLGINPRGAFASTPAVPDYLGRSSYMSLSTPKFGSSSLGNTNTLTLEAVTDLDPALAGSEDAFSLLFSSDSPLDGGIRTFSHPDLGVFDFFIAPIEGNGKYEVVVNRSVAAPKHVPRQKQPARHSGREAADRQARRREACEATFRSPLQRRRHVRRDAGRGHQPEVDHRVADPRRRSGGLRDHASRPR